MHGFRFGGEGHGLGGVWNFAPFACDLVQSPYSHLTLCGRVPHNATVRRSQPSYGHRVAVSTFPA